MAQQLADAVQVDTGFLRVRGKAVPQRVDAVQLGDVGEFACQASLT